MLLPQILPLSEAVTQGLLRPAEANLGHSSRGFGLTSCPRRSLKVLML
jgi:hypothetical protein